jgi:hypothetical protein
MNDERKEGRKEGEGRGGLTPAECHDSTTIIPSDSILDRGRNGPTLDARWRVLNHVQTKNGGGLSDVRLYPRKTDRVLLTAQECLAVIVDQQLHQRLRGRRGVVVDQCARDLVRPPCRRRRELDRVDQVPAPVVLDRDGVGTGFQQDLARRRGLPLGSLLERDLAASVAVEGDEGYFGPIGRRIDEVKVVEFLGVAGDGDSDRVGVRIEAFDIAGAFCALVRQIFRGTRNKSKWFMYR